MSFTRLLNEEVQVTRRADGLTDLGEPLTTFSEVAVAVCTIQQDLSPASLNQAGENHQPRSKMWCPIGTDIRVGDHIVRATSQELRVGSVSDAVGRGHHIEALLYEVC